MPRHTFTPETAKEAQKRSAGSKRAMAKIHKELSYLGFTGDVIKDAKDVAVELIHAAQTNPVIGVVVGIVTLNVLYRSHVIDNGAYTLGIAFVGAAGGLSLAQELENLIPGISLFTGGSKDADLIKPVAQTYTNVDAKGDTGNKTADAMIAAALGNIVKGVAAA